MADGADEADPEAWPEADAEATGADGVAEA